ncbi:hypothetical protein LX97_02293 [Nonlabens dokdonensis]|uniref:Type II toxin-antitoxin system RelE/ParE family toxin n=1 Tax=Nonlabens dokdonensis TaxID=328515 RepID=A0ABX5PY15_9FLAO|nr:hypothetical protein LX97_02293 [Nonlabens dokdonensis]
MLKYIVEWTLLADASFEDELDFILLKWNNQEVLKFIDLVDQTITTLATGTIQGKVSKKSKIRSFLISKQTTLFFSVDEQNKQIYILLFWNNKSNPKTLKRLLERFE